jgi:hypothetical protein
MRAPYRTVLHRTACWNSHGLTEPWGRAPSLLLSVLSRLLLGDGYYRSGTEPLAFAVSTAHHLKTARAPALEVVLPMQPAEEIRAHERLQR